MQVQVDIEFDQLLKIVRTLPSGQLKKLQAEIEKNKEGKKSKKIDLEKLLLNGPVATKKQMDVIKNNRKTINQWRAKS